jgi:hypothetical protein
VKALVFHGVGDIRVDDVDDPRIEQPTDAVVRSAGRHGVLRRAADDGSLQRAAGREGARALRPHQPGRPARRGRRRPGAHAVGHLPHGVVRGQAGGDRRRRHRGHPRLRAGRAVRDRQRAPAGGGTRAGRRPRARPSGHGAAPGRGGRGLLGRGPRGNSAAAHRRDRARPRHRLRRYRRPVARHRPGRRDVGARRRARPGAAVGRPGGGQGGHAVDHRRLPSRFPSAWP